MLFFFFLYFFFYLRHSPTRTAHTYGPHLLPTPTTHDPRSITHTHDFYPLPWVIFSHVKISCFRTKAHLIPVYITIIHDLSHTFFKRNYYEVKSHVKLALRFLQITAKHQDCPFFTVFLTIKTSSQNISITLLQISLKLHEHRGCYWRKKLPWMIFEEQFPVPRYTAASKIGNSVISLLWQLRRHCNPDQNNFHLYLI